VGERGCAIEGRNIRALGGRVLPQLSDEAWALLGMLHRAASGGPPAPEGFKDAYAELQRHGFALGNAITDKGKEAIHERFMGSDPNFRSRS
jgi:hypothetical protein